jgi:hypothetical protein
MITMTIYQIKGVMQRKEKERWRMKQKIRMPRLQRRRKRPEGCCFSPRENNIPRVNNYDVHLKCRH